MTAQTSEQKTLWERVFCPLFGGCPYHGGSILKCFNKNIWVDINKMDLKSHVYIIFMDPSLT